MSSENQENSQKNQQEELNNINLNEEIKESSEPNIKNINQIKENKGDKDEVININEINKREINQEYFDENNRPRYEEIVNYENSLREELERNSPLVSDIIDIGVLIEEYKGGQYENAIQEFSTRVKKWRTVRRDGNCFYRSFLFRLFEEYVRKRNLGLHQRILKLVEDSKNLCIENGYTWMVLEDFYNAFISEWKFIKEIDEEESKKYLTLLFNDKERCNYMIVFIRICIAAYIKQNRFLYENFIEDDIESFCLREVEAIDHECDHVQINAITSYFNIGVNIENLNPNRVDSISFTDNNNPIFIHMFFRPGHYDILYPEQN